MYHCTLEIGCDGHSSFLDITLIGEGVYTMLTNTEILCYVLGWQGGTIFLVAKALGVDTNDILYANDERMQELCRIAQTTGKGA